ncbi:MAG TPA: UDP-N-acetylmuramoyl-tripeptide--D-alanyl-D-alanine ligase [Gaiellaceae bacterium]|nr:UDP-N-acetylmuramoyl-tripeptide--D-alanyl-D-alanine ligase [Gaiellaceae bacterium]
MIPLELAEVARLCPGRLVTAPGADQVTGVQVDSRRIAAGDLFVAVNDAGAAFVDDALALGAAAALVPDNGFGALAALGGAVRDHASARVAGITGSAGKTSTKDILAAICRPRARTVAAEASLNNEIGVPLTLCRLESDTEVCILELAMRGPGQIAELCAFARPHVGVITTIGPAHVEQLGSLEAIVEAKSELVTALPPGGAAIVPATVAVARADIEVIRLGEPDARVADGRTLIRWGGREISFDFTARHQARNALAALHAARALGIEPDGTVDVEFSKWRGEEVPLPGGGLLINDAYNANPLSVQAALEDLVERANGRRTVAVLGEMAELGPDAPRYHQEIGLLAQNLGVDVVIGVGQPARSYEPAVWYTDATTAAAAAGELVQPGDCVLVKGSRAAGLEVVAEALAAVNA